MGDWDQGQLSNRVVISTFSPEALGVEASVFATVCSGAAAWPEAARAFFVPFVVYRPSIIAKLAFINGTTVGSSVDVGVYDEGGNRLCSGGGQAQSGTNAVNTVDVTDTLVLPGLYYMAESVDTTTGFLSRFSIGVAPTHAAFGMLSMASAYPLPATATFASSLLICIPNMAVTMRTLI